MTDPNKFNPWPEEATIRCNRCAGRATFRFPFTLLSAKDWRVWKSRLWPAASATSWQREERWQPGSPDPTWSGWIILEHDPELFAWRPPSGGYRRTSEGIVLCATCGGRRRHDLAWPNDAWYRFEVRAGTLWAWSRAHAVALADFIESAQRDPAAHGPFYLFLRHVPGIYLAAKDRAKTVATIRRELSSRE